MKNADMPAYPNGRDLSERGFTKREEMAARMAAAIIASGNLEHVETIEEKRRLKEQVALNAIDYADKLLDTLQKWPSPTPGCR